MKVYDIFGTPRVILSDSDPIFESKVFKAAHARLNCAVETGTPYHYRTSGGIEIRIKHLPTSVSIDLKFLVPGTILERLSFI